MYVTTDTLPTVIRRALADVDYHKRDIEVRHEDTCHISGAGGDGARAFVILIDLHRQRYETHWGSWGGANMFNRDNPVDTDDHAYLIPDGSVIVTGVVWSHPTHATIHASRSSSLLPITAGEVDKATLDCLYAYGCIKGGQYRRDELARRRVSEQTVQACVDQGFIKVNRGGAGQITTAGRNALGDYRGY